MMDNKKEERLIQKMSKEDHKKRHKLGDNWREYNQ